MSCDSVDVLFCAVGACFKSKEARSFFFKHPLLFFKRVRKMLKEKEDKDIENLIAKLRAAGRQENQRFETIEIKEIKNSAVINVIVPKSLQSLPAHMQSFIHVHIKQHCRFLLGLLNEFEIDDGEIVINRDSAQLRATEAV
jgi:hypothetical protein